MKHFNTPLRIWAEYIIGAKCGCAWLWSGEQVAFCPFCSIQLDLPFEVNK